MPVGMRTSAIAALFAAFWVGGAAAEELPFGVGDTVSSIAGASGLDGGDLNGDGEVDLVTTSATSDKLYWSANSAGTFGAAVEIGATQRCALGLRRRLRLRR